jgi:hypothetical protein
VLYFSNNTQYTIGCTHTIPARCDDCDDGGARAVGLADQLFRYDESLYDYSEAAGQVYRLPESN